MAVSLIALLLTLVKQLARGLLKPIITAFKSGRASGKAMAALFEKGNLKKFLSNMGLTPSTKEIDLFLKGVAGNLDNKVLVGEIKRRLKKSMDRDSVRMFRNLKELLDAALGKEKVAKQIVARVPKERILKVAAKYQKKEKTDKDRVGRTMQQNHDQKFIDVLKGIKSSWLEWGIYSPSNRPGFGNVYLQINPLKFNSKKNPSLVYYYGDGAKRPPMSLYIWKQIVRSNQGGTTFWSGYYNNILGMGKEGYYKNRAHYLKDNSKDAWKNRDYRYSRKRNKIEATKRPVTAADLARLERYKDARRKKRKNSGRGPSPKPGRV